MSKARKYLNIKGDFDLYRGGKLQDPSIAYETWGSLNQDKSNAILIFTGLSPSAHAASSPDDSSAGWWEDMIGPDHAIDTNKFFVICVNSLGSCFGSTGANSIDPSTGRKYKSTFPVLSLEDVAKGGYEVIKSHGISKLACLIGPSMGGMTSLAFEVVFPGLTNSCLLISTCARAASMSIAIRSIQREIIRSDPNWKGGEYDDENLPISGIRLARKIGMLSYRSSFEFQKRFGRERVSIGHDSDDSLSLDFEVESYLDYHSRQFIGQFDPNCYLSLSRASDLFDLADHGGSLEAAMKLMRADKILVIGVRKDQLFPYWQQEELHNLFKENGKDASLVTLDCKQGHDSFLASMDDFRPPIAKFLSSI
jgi:homoserine O-acetyltransferase